MNWYSKTSRVPRLRRVGQAALLLLCLSTLVLPVPGPAGGGAATAHAQAAGPSYVIQAGDSLYQIALSFGITVDQLQAANPGINPDALTVGSALVIPGYEGVSGTLATHSLEPGETLDSLALRLGLKRDTLVRLNGVVNPELLFINESTVTVNTADAAPAVPTGTTYLLTPGEGLLQFAASHNQSPWGLAASNRLSVTAALLSGTSLVVPGGDRATEALPYPLLAVQLRPFPVVQGHTVVVQVDTAAPMTVTGILSDSVLNFETDPITNTIHYALQGIYRLADPDLYPLVLSATDADGQAVTLSQRLPVHAGDYLVDDPLTVDPATIDPAVTIPEQDQIFSITAPATPVKLWDGPFVLPSVGSLRSVFGSLRAYNGGPYNQFHGGVDFSGGEDRPITAPAPGVVVFTGKLIVRGNATVIDHGWGVYTGYWHQSQILVKVGDHVTTGQTLGYQGDTGRVTGPHLHWEMIIGDKQVDALQWTTRSFP
jgi:murein DD-endopeptidase MepM/ murein hydrolase activator NlpD